jgi:hypothetical protein
MRRMRLLAFIVFGFAATGMCAENVLPELTGDWVNGGPYAKAGLRGKAVLFFLMERG